MWAEQFCSLFNDPIEHLKGLPATNKETQQKFAEAVQEVGQKLKGAIIASEEFFEIRSKVYDQRWQSKTQHWSDRLKAMLGALGGSTNSHK